MVSGDSLCLSFVSVETLKCSSSGIKDEIEARDMLLGCCTLAGIGVGAGSIVIGGITGGEFLTTEGRSS